MAGTKEWLRKGPNQGMELKPDNQISQDHFAELDARNLTNSYSPARCVCRITGESRFFQSPKSSQNRL